MYPTIDHVGKVAKPNTLPSNGSVPTLIRTICHGEVWSHAVELLYHGAVEEHGYCPDDARHRLCSKGHVVVGDAEMAIFTSTV